jgi:hypothetical protein
LLGYFYFEEKPGRRRFTVTLTPTSGTVTLAAGTLDAIIVG